MVVIFCYSGHLKLIIFRYYSISEHPPVWLGESVGNVFTLEIPSFTRDQQCFISYISLLVLSLQFLKLVRSKTINGFYWHITMNRNTILKAHKTKWKEEIMLFEQINEIASETAFQDYSHTCEECQDYSKYIIRLGLLYQ